MVVTCSPYTREAEAEESSRFGPAWLHSEFQDSQDQIVRSWLKKGKEGAEESVVTGFFMMTNPHHFLK